MSYNLLRCRRDTHTPPTRAQPGLLTVYDGVCHTPPGSFPKLNCSTTGKCDKCPESSRRDFFNADLFGTGVIPTVEISTMKNRPRGVIYSYTVVYASRVDSYSAIVIHVYVRSTFFLHEVPQGDNPSLGRSNSLPGTTAQYTAFLYAPSNISATHSWDPVLPRCPRECSISAICRCSYVR